MAPDDRNFLKRFFQNLLDESLDPTDERYVPLNENPDLADVDPVDLLANAIEWTAESVQLFSGYRGTGKSTELKRLKARLEESGYLVFLCDIEDYLNLSTPVDVSDFLVVVAGMFGEAVSERLKDDGHPPLAEGYWERFRTFSSGLRIVDPNFDALGIRANLKSDPAFKEHLQQHMGGHLDALVADVRAFLQGCVKRMRDCYGDREIVLLLDSFEHIRGTLANAEAVYGSVGKLFAVHSEELRLPSLHVIYTVPPYLNIRHPDAERPYARKGVIVLPACKLHSQGEDRTLVTTNFGAMERIVGRRGDWRKLLGDDNHALLDRLISSSAGHLRDLLHLFRQVLLRAKELPVPERIVDAAIGQMRSAFLPISNRDALWLAEIADRHQVVLDDKVDLPALARFLDTHLVICYRNAMDGEEWYDVHPLVREHVLIQAERARDAQTK